MIVKAIACIKYSLYLCNVIKTKHISNNFKTNDYGCTKKKQVLSLLKRK